MNLRNVGSYDVGLDLGTGSVGWAVVDSDGGICHFKGKPTWGSRIFPSAETAAGARVHRGQRRRYDRRRQRLKWLQEFFLEDMNRLDPDFFTRLNQARLLPEDRKEGCADYHWPLFNESDFNEVDYYRSFPTIYHLRKALAEKEGKADLRLIYLAFHNIVKHRGNFLHQDVPGLSARDASAQASTSCLHEAVEEWSSLLDLGVSFDCSNFSRILEDRRLSRSDKKDALMGTFSYGRDQKKFCQAVVSAVLGYQADFGCIFQVEGEGLKFKVSEEEKAEMFVSSSLPDEGASLFDALCSVHSSYVLLGILKDSGGKTLSFCKVRDYEKYHRDLSLLKSLVRTYSPESYRDFFGGSLRQGACPSDYDPEKASGYTKYNLHKTSYEDFQKEIRKLLEAKAKLDDDYHRMMDEFAEGSFLRRLKTSDNGSIPYQLHLEEMHAIIENQKAYYPFLGENADRIESLVSFRIPYYVGPLTQQNAAVDRRGNPRFAWSVRKEGMEKAPVRPWNWDEVIDRAESAEWFIARMTGTCTYIHDEPVLPKCSLLYEKFCVFNELNGARWTQDGDSEVRFDASDREGIFEDLFKRGSVTYKKVEDWLVRRGALNPHVSGGQGESKFESKLSSHLFFCNVLEVDDLSKADADMAEEIILWNTLFEDRAILKEKIEASFGSRLNADQIRKICKKRFTGWGRLSKKLLCDIRVETNSGSKSIMDVLSEGNPNICGATKAMVFMEILRDDKLGFEEAIRNENRDRLKTGFLSVDELPGSPALRRTVNQAVRIVEEITSITKHAPDNIFIEVTRDEDPRKKGLRTKRRYDRIKEALTIFKGESSGVLSELKRRDHKELDDERLALYFMQNGRSLYSGNSLDIRRLSEYQVDHIIPQSYIKDDSFDNKALVLADENQRKLDSLLLDQSIQDNRKDEWRALFEAGLISEKKYRNLMCDSISEGRLKGFINRQIVETSQIVKYVQMMFEGLYPETSVVPVKAALSSQLREECGFVKCREINDYHHAHDALIACQIGRFIQFRHSGIYSNPIGYTKVVRDYVRQLGRQMKYSRKMPGSASFIVSSFLTSGFDPETGELFKDRWDADFECDRIRKYLNYKDCFISRMPEITSGEFWDATIYPPDKNPVLPLKKGLDPKKYGGFSSQKFAYFFVYECTKKDKKVFGFSPVPVCVAQSLGSNSRALIDYAKQLCSESGTEFVRIARKQLAKYQLVEINGERFYLTGKKEVRNATQIAFDQAQTDLLKRAFEGEISNSISLSDIYRYTLDFSDRYSSRVSALLRLRECEQEFAKLPVEIQANLIKSILQCLTAKSNRIDLSAMGGSKSAGCIQPTFVKIFNSDKESFFVIDQSVTGMFEKRVRLGF